MPAVDRPQQEVLAYMGQLTEELLAVANAQVLAVYLHGSGTLGGWVANSSDVDVLVVLAEQVAPGPAGTLAEVAAATVRACPGTGLEMSIVCRDEAAAPRPPWPFVVHVNTANTGGRKVVLGQGHPGDPDLLLHYAVCRSSGWSVHGPPAADLIGPVPGTAVLDALAEELEWGLDNAPAPYALLNSCRALVYLHEGSLVAKTTGGQWALDQRVGPLDGVRRALAAQAGDLPAAVLTDADMEFIRRTAGRLRAAAAEEVTASASPRSARMGRMSSTEQTLADLGEFGLIDLVSTPADAPHVLVGPGDDAALVTASAAGVLASIDVAVEGRHFRRDWSSALDVGHKVAAANLADIAAMGGTGRSLLVGLSAPGDLPVSWALDLTRGLVEEAALVGAVVVGGDVTAADQVVVAVSVLGDPGERVVRRSGARPGDVVAVAGRLGWAAAGFAVLTRGFRSPRAVVEAHRRPQPPYAAGPQAAAAGATAMIDVSDGLLADLGHVARASGVRCDLRRDAFELPEPLQAVGAALGVDPQEFVLTGGDDHALAACFPAGSVPDGWREVGSVHEADDSSAAVTVDGAAWTSPAGHQHFR